MAEVTFTLGDHASELEDYRCNLIKASKSNDKDAVARILDDVVKANKVDQVLYLRNECGTTPLHEACLQGAVECIHLLLKFGKEANVFDTRGYAPIHCAAYSNQTDTIMTLLDYHTGGAAHLTTTGPNQRSAYEETPLHVACLHGNLEAVELLCGEDAQLDLEDADGNNVMHFISSSNSKSLWAWSIRMMEGNQELKSLVDKKNKHGQTAAHVAASLGNKFSVGALVQLNAKFDLKDSRGQSAKDIMLDHGHTFCYDLAMRRRHLEHPIATAPPSPKPLENLRRSNSIGRSHSIGSGSPKQVTRRSSFTGMDRPRNLTVLSVQSPTGLQLARRGSSFSLKSGYSTKSSNENLVNTTITVSKENLNRIMELHQDRRLSQQSMSSDSMIKTVIEQTAYEPPFQGIHFTKKADLTPRNYVVNWDEHGIRYVCKLFHVTKEEDVNRLNNSLAPPKPNQLKHDKLEVCLAVSMTIDVPIPEAYTIVSPVCFISCKGHKYRQSKFSFTLPHAVENALEIDKDSFKILSMVTCDITSQCLESPVAESPPDVKLEEIHTELIEVYKDHLKFRSLWMNPSLFVVAMRNEPSRFVPRPLPFLRCALFCVYQIFDELSKISTIRVRLYVGMMNKTVQKIMKDMCGRNNCTMEEVHFTLREETFHITAHVAAKDDWTVELSHQNELRFSQVALTRDTDQQPYTHELSYPPHKVMHIVPQRMEGPASCEVILQDSQGVALGTAHFLPYSPYRSATQTPRETPTPTPRHTSPVSPQHQTSGELSMTDSTVTLASEHDRISDNSPIPGASSLSTTLSEKDQLSHKSSHSSLSSSDTGALSLSHDSSKVPSDLPSASDNSASQATKPTHAKPPPYGGPQQQSSLKPRPPATLV